MLFFRPGRVAEAVALLAEHEEARCLAGGATLVAMMNAGLVTPGALVSLAGIPELARISAGTDGGLRIGAMTRHNDTAGSLLFHAGQRVVPAAAARIANQVVRNMGTMGGSISFADPAADYLPALVAAEATVEIAGPQGPRLVPIADFVTDWYTTALEPGELVTAILVPPAPAGSIGIYEKLDRVAGDFAIASVALVLALEDGICRAARIAIGGCGPAPVRLVEAEAGLVGTTLTDAGIAAAGALLAAACDPVDDVRASAAYRRAVVPRLLAKTIDRARRALAA
jgi:carbon-monoxide dehydrogenase medium subunit